MAQERLAGGERPKVIRETDAAAIAQAAALIRGARHAALAVIEPRTGFPAVSRALVATDPAGAPLILVSALSAHTTALTGDARASLLFGEPGKGDPLAHPRITVKCHASRLARDGDDHIQARARFLRRHPKADIYIDFPDFCLFRLAPLRASLNGGFGKAYLLEGEALTITSPAIAELAAMEAGALAHMNEDHAEAVDLYARAFAGETTANWKMTGIDAAGFEIGRGDRLHRIAFDKPLQSAGDLRRVLAGMAAQARAMF